MSWFSFTCPQVLSDLKTAYENLFDSRSKWCELSDIAINVSNVYVSVSLSLSVCWAGCLPLLPDGNPIPDPDIHQFTAPLAFQNLDQLFLRHLNVGLFISVALVDHFIRIVLTKPIIQRRSVVLPNVSSSFNCWNFSHQSPLACS